MILIHQGFDTFDFSLKTNIPVPVAEKFQAAKDKALSTLKPQRLDIDGASFLVREHGTKGGFRFVAACDNPESTWFLKYPKASMPWGISVSIGSNSLALLGLEPCLESVFETLSRLTRSSIKPETSVARFDYAQDFLVEGFEPDPDLFIHHNRTKSKSHHGADVVRVAGASRLAACQAHRSSFMTSVKR